MKNSKKIFLLLVCSFSIGGTFAISKLQEQNMGKAFADQSISEDKIAYELEETLDETINTFAAWIKLPSSLKDNEVGGVILGNHMYSKSYSGTNDYTVCENGHFKVFWSNRSYTHEFENADLRNDSWTHVALVRDKVNRKLSYYVNGELNEVINDLDLLEAVNHVKYRIGMDQASWYLDLFNQVESPFKGEIKQVTLFNDSLSESEIIDIKGKEQITSDDYSSLITNLNFSNWGEDKVIYDTNNNLNARRVTFNKKVALEQYDDFDYSFIVVPDMQAMNFKNRANWLQQSCWIVENKERLNTKFVMYLGDMTEAKYSIDPDGSEEQWGVAQEYITMLDDEVPYSVILGNHDYDNWAQQSRATTMFNKYFPYSKYKEFSYFGGAYLEGCMDNTYSIIDVDGIEYLIFALEEGPRDAVLKWVDRVIDSHPRSRVFITTHAYITAHGLKNDASIDGGAPSKTITYGNVNDATKCWEKCFSKHSNILAIFSGHECCDDLLMIKDTGKYGNTVYSFLSDLQGSIDTIAMNTVFLIKVNERTKKMHLSLYWISEDACFNEQNQFEISFDDKYNPAI